MRDSDNPAAVKSFLGYKNIFFLLFFFFFLPFFDIRVQYDECQMWSRWWKKKRKRRNGEGRSRDWKMNFLSTAFDVKALTKIPKKKFLMRQNWLIAREVKDELHATLLLFSYKTISLMCSFKFIICIALHLHTTKWDDGRTLIHFNSLFHISLTHSLAHIIRLQLERKIHQAHTHVRV